jgi:hypothetical protein
LLVWGSNNCDWVFFVLALSVTLHASVNVIELAQGIPFSITIAATHYFSFGHSNHPCASSRGCQYGLLGTLSIGVYARHTQCFSSAFHEQYLHSLCVFGHLGFIISPDRPFW